MTQSPIFVIGLVVENALEKSRELCGLPISIAKRVELHHYLEIYLSTEGLSKPSLAKAHSNVWFFANLVLKKTVSDKQFSYLVLAVLFPIIGYRIQFSYVPVSACENRDIFNWKTFKQWKQLDLCGPVLIWFELFVRFLGGISSLSVYFSPLDNGGSSNILHSCEFSAISANLLCFNVGRFSVYMDESLSDLESVDIKAGAAVFFDNIGMGLGVGVFGLMSFTLTEL
ncbi:hypothetical protein G9A89_012112 [Geosiphon pyriformis]|nr:hypothetical protein G9A89_012112 [Geosiphon pyriformis]